MKTVLNKLAANQYKNLDIGNGILLHNLNLFIGPNNSGKTNFIRLLHFLKSVVSPSVVNQPRISEFDQAIFQLGGVRILNKNVNPPATIQFQFDFGSSYETVLGSFELEVLVQDRTKKIIINREVLSGLKSDNTTKEKPHNFYQFHYPTSGKGSVSIWKDQHKTELQEVVLENVPVDKLAFMLITRLLEHSKFPPAKTPVYEIRNTLIEAISGWQFYNANHMNLQQILQASPKLGQQDRYLSSSGENLALVLYNLTSDSLDFEEKFNEAIKTLLPDTRRLRAVPSGHLALTLEWYLENAKEPFYLSEMSDGTVRMLCWATILHSPLLPSLLVIEEPEIGIHVAWLKVLAEWIKQASQKTQIIISTHSPDLLDYFTDEADKVLVFNATGPDKSHFEVKHLSQEAIANWVQEGWQLGDLYRVGDPSVGGWPW